VITRLVPSFSVLFPDVFLTKIAEQGFGCPARADMVQRTNYFAALQTRVDQLIAVPSIRQALGAKAIQSLSPMKTARRLPIGLPLADAATAEALTDLLIAKDALLSLVAGGLELSPAHKAARKEHRPWFLLLHSLEQTGVLQGIEETREGEVISPGFPPHPGGRVFVANKARLENFWRDPQRYRNARVIVQAATVIDADAEALMKVLAPI
jgi:hypothetical protein